MNNYFFYNGTNPEYIRIMRDELKLLPSLKGHTKIKQKIETMSEVQDFCRNDINTELLTHELNTVNNVTFYVEDKKQTILGVIVFKIDDAISDAFFDTPPLIRIHAFCTPFSGGNGRKLMNMVIRFGKIIEAEVIQLSASYNAVGFYQKMGFMLGLREAREYKRIKDYNARPSRVSRQNTSYSFEHSLRQEASHNGVHIPPGMVELPFLNMEFHYARQKKSKKSQRSAPSFNTRSVKRRTRRTRSV